MFKIFSKRKLQQPRPAKQSADIEAPQKLDGPPKDRPFTRKEIFVGLASLGDRGKSVRNDGKLDPDMGVVPVGMITYFEGIGNNDLPEVLGAEFEYSGKYNGPAIDPINLNYRKSGSRVFRVPSGLMESGLFRVFADCVPGQIARKNLNRHYPETKKLNDLQTLAWLASGGGHGKDGFSRGFTSGALLFFTKDPGDERPHLDLGSVEDARVKVMADLAGLAVRMTDQEVAASIIHGGIRAKTTYCDVTGEIGKPNAHYIVKFNSPSDTFNSARVEHGTIELARLAGITAARSLVVKVLSKGERVADMYLTERYDRYVSQDGADTRQHRTSLLSLMDHRKVRSQDAGDYEDIFEVIRQVSADPDADCEEMFRRMLFNVAINNTDDHLKNHEMVCVSPENDWRLAPAFDINPNALPYPHATSIAGMANGTLKDDFVLRTAQRLQIDRHAAMRIRDDIVKAVSMWQTVYEMAGCDNKDIEYVRQAISQQGKRAENALGFGKNLPDPMKIAQGKLSNEAIEALREQPHIEIEVTAPDQPILRKPDHNNKSGP